MLLGMKPQGRLCDVVWKSECATQEHSLHVVASQCVPFLTSQVKQLKGTPWVSAIHFALPPVWRSGDQISSHLHRALARLHLSFPSLCFSPSLQLSLYSTRALHREPSPGGTDPTSDLRTRETTKFVKMPMSCVYPFQSTAACASNLFQGPPRTTVSYF